MTIAPLWIESSQDLTHYISLFDKRHINLAWNSLALGAGTTVLSLTIGVPFAFLISRTNLWCRRIFKVIYFIPILIPPYIHAIVWSSLSVHLKHLLSVNIHSVGGAIFVLSLAYFPFVTLLTQSGLKTIDRNLEEASLLCHGRYKTLKQITFPLIVPHIFSGAVFVFIFSIIDFGVPDILRVRVYPVEIFIQFSAFYNEKAAMILSLPLMGIALSLVILQRWYMKSRVYFQISGGISGQTEHPLGYFNMVGFGFCLVVIVLSVVIPVVVLLRGAGGFPNYIRVLNTSGGQITYSLILAFTGAIIALLLALFISYSIVRIKNNVRIFLEFMIFIPLAIPAITMGIGLIKIWNRPFIDTVYGSPLIIVIGYIARFISFVIIAVISGFRQINPRLEEVAFIVTGRWLRIMRRVIVPLLRPCLMAGFFIMFILSFRELGTTLLVIPPGRETIPIKIYNLMHYGAEHLVSALCLMLILIIFVSSGMFLILNRRKI